ncbi:somatostatin-2-like [Boleophthalmus pectinirostris]|uniref:somatostatin-2-like n=1 Tax=Boleophthalmus pectinirostris TaxID=150288 RepID=UPI00242F4F14|nr:somatostatin-2-like [Boleophthalmus pectinirostris]
MLVLTLSSEANQSPVPLDLGQDLEQELDMELTRHKLLQSLSQRAAEDLLLAQITVPEANVLPEGPAGHVNLQRSVETSLPPRERKAGCKNFYWKGLTSC